MAIGTPTNSTSNAGGDILSLTIPSAGTITVSAGELIIVAIGRYSPTSSAIVVGDISNSGTATLGSWTLDRNDNGTTDGGSSYAATGIFSAIVSTGGTLAVTVSNFPATTYALGGMLSVPGSWGASRVETSNGQVVTTGSTNILTGNMTSAGAALFMGVTQINTGVASVGDSTSATNVYKNTSPDTGAASYRIVTSGTTYGFNWTTPTNAVYGATGVVYKEESSGYTLTADQGSYTLTGQTTGTLFARIFAADQGSYTLTGQATAFSYSTASSLTAEFGSYTLVGSNALVDVSMNAEQGSYTLTGQVTGLTYSALNVYTIAADQGSYTLNGQTVNTLFNLKVFADVGSYNLTGRQVGLVWSGAPISQGNVTYRINISTLHMGL